MTCKAVILSALVWVVGCAQNKASESQTVAPSRATEPESPGTVPSEQVDEIHQILARKGQEFDHCWREEAMRTGNMKWVVDFTLKLTIMPPGKPDHVSIPQHSPGSQAFFDCVIGRAEGFVFPAIPTPLEMTWPYSIKPLY